jgi:ATP-dependent helicase HrpB
MTAEQYPVLEILEELRDKLRGSPVVILQAPPGAGKSTVLPLHLMNEKWLGEKKIVMLEPRRLAARAVAERMANLLDEESGRRIGYRVRFDTKISQETKVEVVTEGILTRMLQSDNSLENFGLVVFDEFHERSLHADLALSLCLQVQQVLRDDLKILIMSATLDAAGLSAALGHAPVLTSKGRQFPVSLRYEGREIDQHIITRVIQAIQRAVANDEGDILVFLPGAGEIRRVQQSLEEAAIPALVCPLYGDLTFAKQQEALLPARNGARKIVLATSIAETSLTIEGIRIVVDSGLARVPRFNPRSGLTRLETVRLTKDAADQRAGRAGRLGPGICYRLWTQGSHLSLLEQRKPEILEADLSTFMLELLQWGVKNVRELTWVTQPPQGAVRQALELLQNLEAAEEKMISAKGKKMLQLPTHPRIAHMLLLAQEESAKTVTIAADIAAILEERDPVEREAGADIGIRIEALRKYRNGERFFAERGVLERIEKLAASWRRILNIKIDNTQPAQYITGKLIWAAYPERLAQQQGKHSNRYKLATGKIAAIDQHDPLIRETWLCVAQLDAGVNDGKIFLAAPVHIEDLMDHSSQKLEVRWDPDKNMIVSAIEKRIGPLLLSSQPHHGTIPPEKRIPILAEQIRASELRILGDVEARAEFQSRVLSLHHWRKDEGWPALTNENLLDTLEDWLGPYLESISKRSELEKLDVAEILKASLSWELQQRLELLAPIKIQVPSRSMIKVRYSMHGEPPIMEVRLQELFGLADTPAVNEGRTKVKLHLLSPGFKPVQVTQDLRSFWETTYHEVRKELRVRYPKHHWPEDPWTAEAVRGARRR